MSNTKIILICLGILLAGAGITALIFMTEPEAKMEGATKKTAMLVDVIEVSRGTFRPTIVATGTVQPAEEVMLRPQVNGQVVRRSPAFTPGGYVKQGEVLLQLDPSDYENTLALRQSELQQIETDLSVEMGRQQVAQLDYQLVGDSLSPEEKALVLRQPQLNAVKARIRAAEAAVKQARLELERTTIRAPFDAHVLSRNVTLGSQVGQNVDLGRLVGTDAYWVEVTVPVSKLRWLRFPSSERDKGSMVNITNPSAWPEDYYREGYLYRQIGALDGQTRLARVLVLVPDPLLYHQQDANKPKLLVGAFVETQMQGEALEDVVKLNRDYLRSKQTVWVMEADNTLSIRDVTVVFSDATHAYISEGLQDNEKVVTTNLSTVVDGIGLRLEGEADSPSSGDSPPPDDSPKDTTSTSGNTL